MSLHEMVELIVQYDWTIHRGDPTGTARDWIDHGFTATSARPWLEADVWDPYSAAPLAAAGVRPQDLGRMDAELINAICNGDIAVEVLVRQLNALNEVEYADADAAEGD